MAVIEFQASTEHRADGTCVISVAGDLDLYTAPELERSVSAAINGCDRTVVLDLSECTFIDSTTLGILLKIKRGFPAARLAIVASAATRRPFELTGLDRLFVFRSTLDEAVNGTAP